MSIQQRPFQPLHFLPADQKGEILDLPVTLLNAVAHTSLLQGGNHWCFYLSVPDTNTINTTTTNNRSSSSSNNKEHSICIDITPSHTIPSITKPNGSKANMIISYLPYPISPVMHPNSLCKVVPLKTRTKPHVRAFVDPLLAHNRHQYEFNELGQRCRFWVRHQIELFGGCGLLLLSGEEC